MSRVKIAVLKGFSNEEIFDGEVPDEVSRYGSKCHRHNVGQEFIMENLNHPADLCIHAFTDIYRDLVHIAWEGDFPWIKKAGTTFSSCTDGKKPVIFKLEKIE